MELLLLLPFEIVRVVDLIDLRSDLARKDLRPYLVVAAGIIRAPGEQGLIGARTLAVALLIRI